jgi:hypothetical protein
VPARRSLPRAVPASPELAAARNLISGFPVRDRLIGSHGGELTSGYVEFEYPNEAYNAVAAMLTSSTKTRQAESGQIG